MKNLLHFDVAIGDVLFVVNSAPDHLKTDVTDVTSSGLLRAPCRRHSLINRPRKLSCPTSSYLASICSPQRSWSTCPESGPANPYLSRLNPRSENCRCLKKSRGPMDISGRGCSDIRHLNMQTTAMTTTYHGATDAKLSLTKPPSRAVMMLNPRTAYIFTSSRTAFRSVRTYDSIEIPRRIMIAG
jgi:hypothetical protein